jgi:hypothetical protein
MFLAFDDAKPDLDGTNQLTGLLRSGRDLSSLLALGRVEPICRGSAIERPEVGPPP